jgi:hypothetical protein
MVEQEFVTRRDQLERSGTPLRKFWGEFVNAEKKQDTYGNLKAHLYFDRVEIVKSIVPYSFPTAELIINYSLRSRSAWGLFMDSLDNLEGEVIGLDEVKGSMLLLEMEEDHEYSPAREETADRPAQERFAGSVWRIMDRRSDGTAASAEGMSDGAKQAHMLTLIDGKDAAEFSQAALQDPIARTMSDEIMTGQVAAGLIAEGKIEERDGKYWVTS